MRGGALPYYTLFFLFFSPKQLRKTLNPKFAERQPPCPTRFYGILPRSARHFWRAERRDRPSRALSGTSLRSANFGLRQSGGSGGGGPSLLTEDHAFRQTAAPAPTLQRATGHCFAKVGARMAEIRGPYTEPLVVAHRTSLPVRLFGGYACCLHAIVRVRPENLVVISLFYYFCLVI